MKTVFLILIGLTLGACAHRPPQPTTADAYPPGTQEPPAKPEPGSNIEVSGPSGVKGNVVIKDEGKTIHVVGSFTGLAPNSVHGLHVHENGSCEGENFASAGGHFNPWKTKHGGAKSKMRHAGDLGNIVADADGNAKIDERIPSGPGLDSFGGKSLVIHARQDDEHSQPAGGSGDRIACGLIKQRM